MTGPYRVDHLPKGTLRPGPPSWHPDQAAADAEEARLRRAGCELVVAWREGEVEA